MIGYHLSKIEGVVAVTCPIGFDIASLRVEVQTMYSRVAASPDGEFHFHRGPQYAVTMLGYDAAELAALPGETTSSFAGVGNPLAIGRIPVDATVVDIGCGAGMDLLLAARRTGPNGRAIGIDMTEAMRRLASQGAAMSGLAHLDVKDGDATRLPLDDRSVDVVISNGVLNLVPGLYQKRNARLRRSPACSSQAVACRLRTSSSARRFLTAHSGTSISGPVELPVLCWKQS